MIIWQTDKSKTSSKKERNYYLKNKCVSAEAKKFENKLNEVGISYNEFVDLRKSWDELTIAGQAEVDDMLSKICKPAYEEFDYYCRQHGLTEIFKTASRSTYEWMLEKLRCRNAKGYCDDWNCKFEIRFR